MHHSELHVRADQKTLDIEHPPVKWARLPEGGRNNCPAHPLPEGAPTQATDKEFLMDTKLIAALACAAALALGACSGNPPAGSTNTDRESPEVNPNDPNPNDDNRDDDNGGSGPTAASLEQQAARAIERADAAAAAGNSGDRPGARTEIENARKAIDDAVKAADAAYKAIQASASATPTAQLAAYDRLTRLLALQRTQTPRLENALDSLAWFGRKLARYELANGEAVTPREDTNKVTINRIPRTIDRSATDSTQVANTEENNQGSQTARFNDKTFKTVMHEDGKKVFSDVDVEFKVDGYTKVSFSTLDLELTIHTGVKLTRDGLVIRTGGGRAGPAANVVADFTDMRRKIRYRTDAIPPGTTSRNTPDPQGQNGWDLEITFEDEPRTVPVPDAPDGKNWVASWQGSGDFYWRAIVPAAESQLETDGDYYEEGAFLQPDGYKDLGTYEVWLSNHLGVDTKLEPPPGQEGTYPEDDEQFYLKYAAYGLFVYTADPETFARDVNDGRVGRVQSLHFGYSAFADEEDKRTTDIGEAITSGKFKGQALAYAFKGTNANNEFKLLRGDATLTVNIPKKTGTGSISGNLKNFKEWADAGWKDYGTNFNVRLTSNAFSNAGVFSGSATATGGVALGSGGGFKGSFYGPRDKSADLEVAGSWNVGTDTLNTNNWHMVGSFGAKQRPAPVLADSGPGG